ncbi:MAG: sodium:proton antiporter [Bacteroidota bacterium]
MDTYTIIGVLIIFTALSGYVNARFFKLPNTIGLMLVTLLYTLIVILLSYFDDSLLNAEIELVSKIDFSKVLMDYMLSFILFAGALHTDFQQLKSQAWPIFFFATFGVLTSTFLIGSATYFLLPYLGISAKYTYCLLFGALISPTDPISVLGILKKANVPKKLEIKIVGESLFNDGVGVVIFLTLFSIASSAGNPINPVDILELFGIEVIGGLVLGFVSGWIAVLMLKSIDDFSTEIIITIALVMFGTITAEKLHLSAPLAMVAAGLMLGNDKTRNKAMSDETQFNLDKFWELVDIILNSLLFVLIGMEILVLTYNINYILAGVIALPIVLLSRYLSLFLPVEIFKRKLDFVPYTKTIMTWGGLRGGISIALALSLQDYMERDLFLIMTYIVVCFSILVQGLTIQKLVKRLLPTSGE